jgi:hypothetical protein
VAPALPFPEISAVDSNRGWAHAYSRDVWNLLQLKYGLAPDRCAYIPNGVERRFFVAREYERADGLRLLHPDESAEDSAHFMKDIHATLLVKPHWSPPSSDRLLKANESRAIEVFRNSDYQVFRFQ